MIHTLCWARCCFPCCVPDVDIEYHFEQEVKALTEQCKFQEALDMVDKALKHTSCGWFNTNTNYNYAQQLRIDGCLLAYILGRYHKALEYDSVDTAIRILCYIKLGKEAPKRELALTCPYIQGLHCVAHGRQPIGAYLCNKEQCMFYIIKIWYALGRIREAKKVFDDNVRTCTKALLFDAIAEYNAGDYKQAYAYLSWVEEKRTGLAPRQVSVLMYYIGLCNIQSNNLYVAYKALVSSQQECFDYDSVYDALRICKGRQFCYGSSSIYYDIYILS